MFGAVGGIVSAGLESSAAGSATEIQKSAIQRIQSNILSQLSPDTLNSVALTGDTQRAQQQRLLFQQMFPDLAAAQTAAERSLSQQAGGYGPQADASRVGSAATSDALSNAHATQENQNQLIDAALAQLKAGATLPPDVEAQLVQSGLEQSGMVTQSASGKGICGQQIRTLLGQAGINLQMQRQGLAANLTAQAQELENQRQAALQNLFPRLAQTQLAETQGASSIFGTTQSATPEAGLSGTQLANSWLSRVGALNSAIGQQAGIEAAGKLAQGQIWGNAIGSAISGIGSLGIGGGGGGLGAGGVPAKQNPLSAQDLTLIG